jgi:hypothetical protein
MIAHCRVAAAAGRRRAHALLVMSAVVLISRWLKSPSTRITIHEMII